jgi:hypothetical protein
MGYGRMLIIIGEFTKTRIKAFFKPSTPDHPDLAKQER